MYEARPDRANLRQGDVIRGIYFPTYSFPELLLLHKIDDVGGLKFDKRVVVGATQRFAVVISQCCEFNEGKRNAFSLAAMMGVKEMLRVGTTRWGFNLAQLIPAAHLRIPVDRLRAANVIDENSGEPNAAVNSYLYDSGGNVLTEPQVVDFTRVISIRMEDQKAVLRAKVLQLDSDHRLEFQFKLAHFYGRPAEE